MIRMLVPLIIILLVVMLLQTFGNRREEPIDVDPVEESRGDEPKGKKSQDDDIIDVEPVESE
ncbi:MAG: hypothetical protein Q4D27_07000 [Coriobacteriia bacterium]|nr:hypothetical protein [Coriobacteriia bacterium]